MRLLLVSLLLLGSCVNEDYQVACRKICKDNNGQYTRYEAVSDKLFCFCLVATEIPVQDVFPKYTLKERSEK